MKELTENSLIEITSGYNNLFFDISGVIQENRSETHYNSIYIKYFCRSSRSTLYSGSNFANWVQNQGNTSTGFVEFISLNSSGIIKGKLLGTYIKSLDIKALLFTINYNEALIEERFKF
jgi:hypothetical protein